jgi:hypothetical protein
MSPLRQPLALVLAAACLLGCDETPTEPFEQEPAAVNALFDSNGAYTSKVEVQRRYSLCGYTYADCNWTSHFTLRGDEFEDHFTIHMQMHGTCVSETTEETWRIKDNYTQQVQRNKIGQEEWFEDNWNFRLVGTGDAPNFKSQRKCRYTMNANGDLVSYHCNDIYCVEFGS